MPYLCCCPRAAYGGGGGAADPRPYNTTAGQHGWLGRGLICGRVRRKSSARDFMQPGLQGCSNPSRTGWLDDVVGSEGSRFAIAWAGSTEGSVDNWQ